MVYTERYEGNNNVVQKKNNISGHAYFEDNSLLFAGFKAEVL